MTGPDSQSEEAGTAFVADAPEDSSGSDEVLAPGSRPPESPSDRPWAAWVAVLGVVAVVAVSMAFAFDLERAGTPAFWAYAIVPTWGIAAVALVRAARDGELREMLQPAWGDATRGILSAGLLLGAAIGFAHVITPTGSPRESWLARLYLQIGDPTWLRLHGGLIAVVVVVAAAGEEIVWRGLVTRLIAERVGSRSAWAWAAIPYALAHVPTVWALRDPEAGWNPLLVVAALGLGLVWGAMARQARRLAPAILSHAAFDWCVIMLFRLWGPGV